VFGQPAKHPKRPAKLVGTTKGEMARREPDSNRDAPVWLPDEDFALLAAVRLYLSPAGAVNWALVADAVFLAVCLPGRFRSRQQCRDRYFRVIMPREDGKLPEDDEQGAALAAAAAAAAGAGATGGSTTGAAAATGEEAVSVKGLTAAEKKRRKKEKEAAAAAVFFSTKLCLISSWRDIFGRRQKEAALGWRFQLRPSHFRRRS
jgi:hypothetical protein